MDYSKIRGKESGQRQSFEALVCQLAYVDKQDTEAQFQRVDGSGGDGGVEAYWLFEDGSKVGYQAKFFCRAGDIGWGQIDKSVKQALQYHPTLKKYILAIACDLTDAGDSDKRMGARQHWNRHKLEWEKQRAETGLPVVDFTLWSAADLDRRLVKPNAEGLRYYWFRDTELSLDWFKRQVNLATASLEERYHAEDHVEVGIERLFKVMLRDDEIKAEIITAQEAVAKANILSSALGGLPADEIRIHLRNLKTHTFSLSERAPALNTTAPWFDPSYTSSLTAALETFQAVRKWFWEYSKFITNRDEVLERDLERFFQAMTRLEKALTHLQKLLSSSYFAAERERVAMLLGRAGAGKSHLFGRIADKAVAEGRPVILVLGHQISSQDLWGQITERLALGRLAADAFLQAFDAASHASGKRGLFLIDAINEGAGSRFWRAEIAGVLHRLAQFPNIALVISCRTEYMPYALTEGVRGRLPSFEIRGFETYQEQASAARVYMNKQGLSQPSTPWMAAEFVNPLFLRSACLALKKEGLTQFPKGFKGTRKIFNFYLDSVAKHLSAHHEGGDELIGPTRRTLQLIAHHMVVERRDHLPRVRAFQIAKEAFMDFSPPEDATWFELLRRNGLLRVDPLPHTEDGDTDAPVTEIVRFSFQRFQDHLMAEVLLKEVNDIRDALATGVLAFIHQSGKVDSMWMGLVEALCIQVPERFNREFLDALPAQPKKWRPIGKLERLFVESLRWRSSEAFSERTHALFDSVLLRDEEAFDVVIELAVVSDHPWNARALHTMLMCQSLVDRDTSWSVHINRCSTQAGSALDKLYKWCLLEQGDHTDREVQYLCSIVLTWMFTSSNRLVRDFATKALVSLLIARQDLYNTLCEAFSGLDDMYVWERLHAAAYGACCNDPNPARLRGFATTAYLHVFDTDDVPLSLLLRDYARRMVELAVTASCLDTAVDPGKCQPPYQSAPPQLNVTQAMLDQSVAHAGHNEIEAACMGTFASHEIKPTVENFLNTRIKSGCSATDHSLSSVINHEEAQRWIAKRAYDLGWSVEKFPPEESQDLDYPGGRPVVERIAEKYQWMALNELLCRLADNHELDVYPKPRAYFTPSDIGFQRDIDPTLLSTDADDSHNDDWVFIPPLVFEHDEEQDLMEWPVRDNPADLLPQLVSRTDPDGKEWWVMHEWRALSNLDNNYDVFQQGLRQQEFRRILPVIVKQKDSARFIKLLCLQGALNISNWRAPTYTSTTYFREAPCPQQHWLIHKFPTGKPVEYALPTYGFHWEYELDLSIAHGVNAQLPAAWLTRELALVPLLNDHRRYVDPSGEARFLNGHRYGGDNYALCDKAFFQEYLARNELQCLWIFSGERSVWPEGEEHCTAKRRFEGVFGYKKGGQPTCSTWYLD
ncbi:NACHT domain-containing protein [Pseudomonas poae]|nr:ATP-binding protein [Pseudomonas poae]